MTIREEPMGEFIIQEEYSGCHVLGLVLLQRPRYDFDKFLQRMALQWGILPQNLVQRQDTLVFEVSGMQVSCCLVGRPVPDDRAQRSSLYSILWEEGAEKIKGYQAHLILSVRRCSSILAGYMLCTGLASCLLEDPNVVAFLFPEQELLLEPAYFIQQAGAIQEGELPVELWVSFGSYDGTVGNSGYTFGLEEFEKHELEVLESTRTPDELLDLLYDLVYHLIAEDISLHPGDTIGFWDNEPLQVTLSEGVAVEGDSFKIDF